MQKFAFSKTRYDSVFRSPGPGRKNCRVFRFEPDSVNHNCVDAQVAIDIVGRVEDVIGEGNPNLVRRDRRRVRVVESLEITGRCAFVNDPRLDNGTINLKCHFFATFRTGGKNLYGGQHQPIFESFDEQLVNTCVRHGCWIA